MNKKAAQKLARDVNTVVHCHNLYRGESRFIDARAGQNSVGDWEVSVENLQTGARVRFDNDGSFRTGHGSPVEIY